jgi:hypothetical protein
MEPPLNNKRRRTNSEPRSTNNNDEAIHPDEEEERIPDQEERIPKNFVFTWDTIVGHDLASREVTVLVATHRGPQRSVPLDMDCLEYSSALTAVADYLRNLPPPKQANDRVLLEDWIAALDAEVIGRQEHEQDMIDEVQPEHYAFCCAACTCHEDRKLDVRNIS